MNLKVVIKIGVSAVAAIGAIAGVSSLIVGAKNRKDVKGICTRLDKSIETLKECTQIEVDNSIVQAAVEEATQKAVDKEVRAAANAAVAEIRMDIKARVRDQVDDQVNGMRSKIKEEIERKIGHIDISEMKEEVLEKASEMVKDRLNVEVDGIASRFRSNLEDSSKILKVVADKLG